MRKVKVAAAFLCLLASGMIGGITYNGNEMSVAHADQRGLIVEMTAESVTTTASIETTAIVTTTTARKTEKTAAATTSTTLKHTGTSVTTSTSASVTSDTSTTESTSETETESTSAATSETTAASLAAIPVTEPAEVPTVPDTEEAVTRMTTFTETVPETEAPETEPEEMPAVTGIQVTEREYIMLCNVVGHEYGSDFVPVEEKALVVEVIMNRVNSPAFPDTIYDVLMQENQFTGLENLVHMSTMSAYVTPSVREAVDLYLAHPEQFDHGYLFFNGDGKYNYFRTTY